MRRATDDFEAFLFHRFVDFEKICDNLPDAIYIADKEGTTVYVNDMYQQLSGILKTVLCHFQENYITVLEAYDPADHGMTPYTRREEL